MRFDLKDRTYRFALDIVRFCYGALKNYEFNELKRQLIRSGTSIGANVEEADGARTRREFANKMTIARNEAKETRFWLRLIIDSGLLKDKNDVDKATKLLSECAELIKILSSIIEKFK